MQSKRSTDRKQSSQERSHSDPASQDWVCLKCNNLNFSFRTRCNRCKVQSRYDNRPNPQPTANSDPAIQEYYYYAHYFYPAPPAQENMKGPNLGQKDKVRSVRVDPRSEEWKDEVTDDLPSVSLLVKKCKDAAAKKGEKREHRELEWRLFGEEIWNTDEIPTESWLEKELEWTDDEEASEQFRLSVEKMIT